MKLTTLNVENLYVNGLKEYLSDQDEEYLSKAYQQSRTLLQEGLSELEVVTLHHQALHKLFKNGNISDKQKILKKASVYLKEWLAPFEIKLQSYRALIEELNKKNAQLEEEIENRRQIQKEFVASNTYFQSLIENAQDIITVTDPEGIIRYNSPSIHRILGYKQHELVGKNAFSFIHEDDRKRVRHTFFEIRKEPNQNRFTEFRFRHKKGNWVYLESIAKNVPESRDGPIIVVNSRNVTNRKMRMRKLREHRAKLAEAQRIAKVGSWEWIPGQKVNLEWSDEMCRIYGYSPENFDCSYDTYASHIHPDDRERVEKTIELALEYKNPFSYEHRIIRPDGEVRTVLGQGRVLTDEEGKVIKLIGTGQDITEQKEKEKRLRRYSERLRKLSERVERTREEERIRIAREIHDELGQMLTVLKMDVSMMNGEMKKRINDETLEYFNEEATKILDRINTIMDSVQRITTELRPQVLDNLGLLEALQWQAREFEKRTNLEISFDSEISQTDFLSEAQSTTLFRVFQETMNNILRHAKASKVEIELKMEEDNLLLSIQDDGVGITEEQKEAPSSFGIIGMRERTRFLGGDVEIEGSQETGTKVILRIPLVEQTNF